MKYTQEQRKDFELWANSNFFDGIYDISEQWDEERNCYRHFAFHMAFHAWMAANGQYKYVSDCDQHTSLYMRTFL